jgi:hypothetical protein
MDTVKAIVEKAMVVRPLTEINERECVAELAIAIPEKGTILEVGCLYGGMTAVLGLSAPSSTIFTMDDFSWHPEDDTLTSAKLLYKNMEKIGVSNVKVLEGDSRLMGRNWSIPIDLLWIDGGHHYDYVLLDLIQFGVWANTIAVHDYTNPFWQPQIQRAVDDFLRLMNGDFYLQKTVGTIVVIQRK